MYIIGREFRKPTSGVSLKDISQKLQMPSLTIAPVAIKLENAGLLTVTEQEHLQPGREMSRVTLNDILAVVREQGETGSHLPPAWDENIDAIGAHLDSAVANTLSDRTLSDVLDDGEG